jgi:hypothetical protein
MSTAPEALADTTVWIALGRGRPDARDAVRALLERRALALGQLTGQPMLQLAV